MFTNKKLGCAAIAVAMALPLTANAGFRCRNGALINEGDSVSYLLEQCGAPMSKTNLTNEAGAVAGQRYRYADQTDRMRVYVVDVYNGKVKKVDTDRQ